MATIFRELSDHPSYIVLYHFQVQVLILNLPFLSFFISELISVCRAQCVRLGIEGLLAGRVTVLCP